MPDAPRTRPAGHTVLGSFAGHVRARPGTVFDALTRWLDPGSAGFFSADPVASLVIVQGSWWYRAEFRIVPDDTGSRVEQTLLNVAERAHWAGPIVGRKTIADAPVAFEKLMRRLREELE